MKAPRLAEPHTASVASARALKELAELCSNKEGGESPAAWFSFEAESRIPISILSLPQGCQACRHVWVNSCHVF